MLTKGDAQMSRLSRWLVGVVVVLIVVVGGIVVDIVTTRHVLPRGLIQPTPYAIARTFVDATTSGDVELAKSLTDGAPACIALSLIHISEPTRPY